MDPPDPTFCNFITSYRVRSFSFLYPQQQHETCYSIDAWWKLVEQNWKTILYYSKHRPFGLPNRPSNLMLASDFVTAGSDHASNNLERAGQPSDSIPAAWLTDTAFWTNAMRKYDTNGSWLGLCRGPFETERQELSVDRFHNWCPFAVSPLFYSGRGGVGKGRWQAFDKPCKNSKWVDLTVFWPSLYF